MDKRSQNASCIKRLAQRGFTLVEMVVVLVVVGVIAASAAMLYNTDDFTAFGEKQALESTLRFAQMLAMGDTTPWNVQINGNRYELQRNCTTQNDPSTRVLIPGAGDTTYYVPNGEGIFGSENVVFNTRGQPATCTGTAQPSPVTVTVNAPSDSKVGNIVITQNTGFIQ